MNNQKSRTVPPRGGISASRHSIGRLLQEGIFKEEGSFPLFRTDKRRGQSGLPEIFKNPAHDLIVAGQVEVAVLVGRISEPLRTERKDIKAGTGQKRIGVGNDAVTMTGHLPSPVSTELPGPAGEGGEEFGNGGTVLREEKAVGNIVPETGLPEPSHGTAPRAELPDNAIAHQVIPVGNEYSGKALDHTRTMVRIMEEFGDGRAIVRWPEADQQPDPLAVYRPVHNFQEVAGNDGTHAVAYEVERAVIPCLVPLIADE
jgi:hypothetical protein